MVSKRKPPPVARAADPTNVVCCDARDIRIDSPPARHVKLQVVCSFHFEGVAR
jgi:hypothetical protein